MELTNINVIRQLFERHGFSFTKSLGQNFLINPAVCPKIAEMGGAKPGVCALEIGTGVGVLTKELATRCEKVIAVEIDTTLKPILEETLAEFDNVEIVFADVMETDLAALLAERLLRGLGGRGQLLLFVIVILIVVGVNNLFQFVHEAHLDGPPTAYFV